MQNVETFVLCCTRNPDRITVTETYWRVEDYDGVLSEGEHDIPIRMETAVLLMRELQKQWRFDR